MLKVEFGEMDTQPCRSVEESRRWANVKGRACWFITVVATDGEYAIPVEFAREIDAEIAMKSVADLISWDGPIDSIRDRLDSQYNEAQFKQKLLENLLW